MNETNISGTSRPKLIIWDFDGVICDSLIECITVTALAAFKLGSPTALVSEANLHHVCSPEVVMPLYERMKLLRPFIVTGQDYLWQYFNLEYFELGNTPKDLTDYNRWLEGVFSEDLDRTYQDAFYMARHLLRDVMSAQYRSLFRPYLGALFAFRVAQRRHRNYICTARDQRGVEILLETNGVEFPRNQIWSKDFNGLESNPGMSKSEQILSILAREDGRDAHFLLIEDQVKVPAELSDHCKNMSVVYAAYGYGLEIDWRRAQIPELKLVKRPSALANYIY
jgi:phosphoglycolate phosphatase-like HAD superfamily hydrolase